MAKQTPAASSPHVVIADGEPLNLQNRYVAAVLAWIIPGAGHFYQRRYFKAWIFSISVLSCFVIGVFIADGKCVYASWQGPEKRWQFVLQAGAGLPTFPAMVQAWHARGKVARTPLWNGFMAAPMDTAELDEWHHDT
ncbi:MAG: hypothetical protein KDB03_25650, partial [Planctomycetales bacterium]|nr:hypothetical protein [Planctomycetales bacterium]